MNLKPTIMKIIIKLITILVFVLSEIYSYAQTDCAWQQGEVISYTQTNWAANTTALEILNNNYNTVYASTFGALDVGVVSTFQNSITFTSAAALLNYLPAAGTAAPLSSDYSNPTTTTSGIFGGDVTALKLDIDFADAGVLIGDNQIVYGDLLLYNMNLVPDVNGLRIRDVLVIANTLLSGVGTSYSIADIDPLVQQLTGAFINGTPSQFALEHLRKGWKEGDFLTRDQGEWDATTDWYTDYNQIYSSTFGLMEIGVLGSTGYSIAFSGSGHINEYFIQTGTPAPLNADLADPNTSSSGRFGGEVLALHLNVVFSDSGVTPSYNGVAFGDLILHDLNIDELNELSVRDVLSMANRALGGLGGPVSIDLLNGVVAELNVSFLFGVPSIWAQEHLKKGWGLGEMCTNTQYGWENFSLQILTDNYYNVYANSFGVVEVGIPGSLGYSLTFSSTSHIVDYFVASGTPSVLTADLVDPTTSSSGVFGGEVLALQLTVDFSEAGYLTGSSNLKYGNLVLGKFANGDNISDYYTTTPLTQQQADAINGKTVSQILVEANVVLGGGSGTCNLSVEQLSVLVSELNGAFAGCIPGSFAQKHIFNPCSSIAVVNTAPLFVSPSPTCSSTIEAKVGVATSFTVKASDADAGDNISLTVNGLPAGATLTPSLPVSGNPDSTVFNWTPTTNGTVTVSFIATDNNSASASCQYTINVTSCPHGGGFWKNNSVVWPVQSLLLGTVSYTKQQLISILNRPVGNGNNANASLILSRQLIPAKLSIAAGATAPSSITTAISTADALIGSNTIPMNVKVNTALGQQMVTLASQLEAFNNGSMTTGCTGARVTFADEDMPFEFNLDQNIPNPFSTLTEIHYTLPYSEYNDSWNVTLTVYTMEGREIALLVNEPQEAGMKSVIFDASNLSEGLYFYRLTVGDRMQYKKMIVVK